MIFYLAVIGPPAAEIDIVGDPRRSHHADSGEILMDGNLSAAMSERCSVPFNLGFVFQQSSIFKHLNALENVRSVRKVHGYSKEAAYDGQARCCSASG